MDETQWCTTPYDRVRHNTSNAAESTGNDEQNDTKHNLTHESNSMVDSPKVGEKCRHICTLGIQLRLT